MPDFQMRDMIAGMRNSGVLSSKIAAELIRRAEDIRTIEGVLGNLHICYRSGHVQVIRWKERVDEQVLSPL